MTERGLPIVDGAPACPFVAFDDDRDERATSPDHRHRCYAENPPAPRALAHQEAYCLSSAFPVCPTFQDWARREAAHAQTGRIAADDADDDLPPLVADRPPRRPGQQWSAPPPWLRGGQGPGPAPGQPQGQPTLDSAPGAGQAPSGPARPAAGLSAGGLSGSYADRMISGDPAAAGAGQQPGMSEPEWDDRDAWDAEEGAAEADLAAGGALAAGATAAGAFAAEQAGYRGGPPAPEMDDAPQRRRGQERVDAGRDDPRNHDAYAPSWERPRRLEAYPTLRSRRLPGAILSPILLAIIAVVLAGAALFFLPSLLGIGSGGGGGSPTPSTTPSAAPSVSEAPTEVPGPTPFIYTVKQGDLLGNIAKHYGVTVQQILDANPQITNPDKIAIGDQIVIPITQPSELPAAS